MRRIGKSILSIFLAGVMTLVPVGESFAAGNAGNYSEISMSAAGMEEDTKVDASGQERAESEYKETLEPEDGADMADKEAEEESTTGAAEDESEAEGNTDTEDGTDTDTGNTAETDIETDNESETQSDPETEAGTTEEETDEEEVGAETETETESGTVAETEIESAADEETETDSDVEETKEESTEESTETKEPALSIERTELTEEERAQLMEELRTLAEAEGHVPNGYIDVDYEAENLSAPVDTSDDSFAMASRATVLPRSYDSRESGTVSAVKNQGSWGTCWAFSAVATAESAYKRIYGSEANLSEIQLVKFFYEGDNVAGPDGGLEGDKITALGAAPVQRGGNSLFTTFAMASWTGIADEATDASLVYPYTSSNNELPAIDDQYAYMDTLHLKNAYWINISDTDSIKKAIMEYGTVGVSYYQESIYSSDYITYYMKTTGGDSTYQYDGPAVYYNPVNTSTNHAVAIVGWDDDFDRNYFQNTPAYASGGAGLPQKNGAWLIKNSWGTGVADDGFFWISYEDSSIEAAKTVFAFDFDRADNYDHNYQYDGSAGMRYINGSSVTAAAVYTTGGEAGSYQTISAVGVGFASASTDYTVKIYTNLTDKNKPELGDLKATVTGTTSFEGFYTIELDKAILTEAGKDFSVVITASKSGEKKAALSVDTSYTNGNWIEFTANTENDRTFIKSGNTWKSTTSSSSSPYTVRIKAYTNDVSAVPKARDRVLIDSMLEEIVPQTFNGTAVEPQVRVVFAGELLKEGIDYEVVYDNNDKISTSKAKAKVTIVGKGDYSGTIEREFTITKKAVSADMISIPDGVFDGTTHKSLEVVFDGIVLEEGTDYTAKYSKTPVNAGKYTVTVTGKGNYSGSAKKSFTIDKIELTEEIVSLDYGFVNYSGKENKPAVTVQVGNYKVPSTNYTVKYKDNKTAGTASVTITGKTNCQGSVTKQFMIGTKSIEAERTENEEADDITVTVKGGTYTGNEVKPAVTVKDGKTTLKLNKDYTLTYRNNINATTENSKATVTISGMGNYSGTVEKQYEIVGKKVTAGKIKAAAVYGKDDVSVCTVMVDGKEIAPSDYELVVRKAGTAETVETKKTETAVKIANSVDSQPGAKYDIDITLQNNYIGSTTVKNVVCKKSADRLDVVLSEPEKVYTYTGSAIKPAVTVRDGETVLKTKTAYSVTYSNHINAGTATITITGKGEYAGTISIPFTIEKKDVSETLNIAAIPAKTYTGKPITPTVKVKNGKVSLKTGKDYTCSYFDNLNVSYDENNIVTEKAKVEIRLSDNYTINGSNTTEVYFKINPAKISKVTASSCYYKGEGVAVEPEVTVKAGSITVNSDDYTVTYSGNTKINSKAGVTAEIKAGRNFTGSKSTSFKITKEPLSKVTVTGISDQIYSGGNITFSDIALENSGQEMIAPNDYTVTYKKNKNVGTAQVIIKANAGSIYSGSITKKFKIGKAELNTVISADAMEKKMSAKTYTGGKQTYTSAEIKGIINDVVSGDAPTYKVSYSNHVNAGTASLILTGTGNYTGKVEIPFTIVPCDISNVNIRISDTVKYNGGSPVYAAVKSIVYGKKKLKRSTDYTLSYINSSRRGIAAVQITGNGNYTGTKTIYYVIE